MTQHNVFVRKFGDKAVVITVTDWDDFKELEKHSNNENPDFLLGAVTTKTIYSNMQPSMLIGTECEVKDITEQTRGDGLEAIITGTGKAGAIWSYKKINGLF